MRATRIFGLVLPFAVVLVGMLLVFGCGQDEQQVTSSPQVGLNTSVEAPVLGLADHHMVRYTGTVGQLNAAVKAVHGKVDRVHEGLNLAKVSGLTDETAAQLLQSDAIGHVDRDLLIQMAPGVEDFEAMSVLPQGYASDPTEAAWFGCQWNLTQIDVPGAWAAGEFGNEMVKVAVLDSGTDPDHQDLVGRVDVAQSASFISDSPCGAADTDTFLDRGYHGTFVSGIVTSNGIVTAGVAPAAQVVGVKVLNCGGSGYIGDIIAGIYYAASLPDVHVINMSLGLYLPKHIVQGIGGKILAWHNEAVDYAVSQGKLVVASAGNDYANLDKDKNYVKIPAQTGGAISIWAGDIDGNLAVYSNHGRSGAWVGAGGGDFTPASPSIPLPDCPLPAVYQGAISSPCSSHSFLIDCSGGTWYLYGGTGTSFSAPAVAGVAALLDGMHDGGMSPEGLREFLKNTADDIGKTGTDLYFSHGRVNAANAVTFQLWED